MQKHPVRAAAMASTAAGMIPAYLPALAAAYDLTDNAIQEVADKAAAGVERLADLWTHAGTAESVVARTLRSIARRYRVSVPAKAGLAERVNRMKDPGWWRRALRERFRAVELHQIQSGAVHRHVSPYVSEKALKRHERMRARVAGLMESLEAINETTGEVIALQELVASSQANPGNRRKAMMARIKGIETHAKAKGHVALFLTLTCPSRMHARHTSGAANDRYDGTYPRKAQAYLGRVWNRALRRASHDGMSPYGLRVVEPHHDACPHWHVLVFIAEDQADAFIATVRAYALADSPNEPGADKHRFTVERIDPAKGSAVGYVAKYVSKSIDGEGVDADSESQGDGSSTAKRIVSWARTWGIRQFQFFGVPPITPTRELYRVDAGALPGQALPELHQASKANDYAAWLAASEAHGVSFRVQYSERPSTRYRDEITKAIKGLAVEGGDVGKPISIETRTEAWRIQPKTKASAAPERSESAGPAHCAPWTRFNNSAPIDLKGLFPGILPGQSDEVGEDGAHRAEKGVPRRAPLPDARLADGRSRQAEA